MFWSVEAATVAFANHGSATTVDSVDGTCPGQYNGSLNDFSVGIDTADWYSFSATDGAMVTISMASNNSDSQIFLYHTGSPAAPGDLRSSYTLVGENDDSGPGTLNSRLEDVVLSAGNYVVAAETRFVQDSDYTVSIVSTGLGCAGAPPGSDHVHVCVRPDLDLRAPYADSTCPSGFANVAVATVDQGGEPVCVKTKTDWRAPYANGACPAGFELIRAGTVESGGQVACFKTGTDVRTPDKNGCPVGFRLVRLATVD